jgi:beta-phosphoglucomutase
MDAGIKSLRIDEERYRLIADNVADVIWTVEFPAALIQRIVTAESVSATIDAILGEWRFSLVSPAVTRLFNYSLDEALRLSLPEILTPETLARVRESMIREYRCGVAPAGKAVEQHTHEVEVLLKDGSSRWCEVVSTYTRNDLGVPTGILGITRDATKRRKAEEALRESESKLRTLFQNLPDVVLLVDRDTRILFINREQPQYNGQSVVGQVLLDFVAPEFRATVRQALEQAMATGSPRIVEVIDVLEFWWSGRLVPLVAANREFHADRAMLICTNITKERQAAEAIQKEQQLLRRLLDLHERERQLIAYEIHDGFAQQLTGALFRLQGFREMLSKSPDDAWNALDSATQLLSRAVDETRRLISGLRPPILDEMGVAEAVQYLIYEHQRDGGPTIEFDHDIAGERFPPPLENAVFRIVQESLNNACRHSHAKKIRVSLARGNDRVCIDVRDWGVGFDPGAVAEQRFGLQGIRERVRLLDGNVAIDSSPGRGTQIVVELPLAGKEEALAVIFDMDGVLVDSYRAHYQSWIELAEADGLRVTEAEFAATFGRTSREIVACLWGEGRYSDAEIAELDQRKEAAYRRIVEADFPAMPGAVALLRALRSAGFRLAVGSSGPPENVELVLDRLGTRELFSAIVTGKDVTRGKPDPEVFLIAASRLGVAPANCVVIEDAPAGIAAANAAGMAGVGLTSTGRTPDNLVAADVIVSSLAEISPHLLRRMILRRRSPGADSKTETLS